MYPRRWPPPRASRPCTPAMDATSRWYHDVTGGRLRTPSDPDAPAPRVERAGAGRQRGRRPRAGGGVARGRSPGGFGSGACQSTGRVVCGACCASRRGLVVLVVGLPRVVRAAVDLRAPPRGGGERGERQQAHRVTAQRGQAPERRRQRVRRERARILRGVAFSSSSADAEGSIAISSMFTPPENQRSSPSTNPAPPPPRCANAHASVERRRA